MSVESDNQRLERMARKLEQPEAASQPNYDDWLGDVLGVVDDSILLVAIGDPALLDRIGRILRQVGAETRFPDVLENINRQCSRMVDIHHKFAAMLDLSVGIADLLYKYLDTWEVLESPVGRRFCDEEEAELDLIRWEPSKPSVRLRRFFERYIAMLCPDEQLAESSRVLVAAIETARSVYEAREEQATAVHALFADRAAGTGVCHPVAFEVRPGAGGVFPDNETDGPMKQAVERAVTLGCRLAGIPRQTDWEVRWSILEPRVFEGESIGLASVVGVASQLRDVTIDCYTAFTGTLAFEGGRVERVEHIREKLIAARAGGFRRVFIPRANRDEVADLESDVFRIHDVDTIDEAWQLLQPSRADHPHQGGSFEARIRRFELECLHQGLKVSREEGPGAIRVRLRVTDHRTMGTVDFYDGKQGIKPHPGISPNTELFRTIRSILDKMFGQSLPPRSGKPLLESYNIIPC